MMKQTWQEFMEQAIRDHFEFGKDGEQIQIGNNNLRRTLLILSALVLSVGVGVWVGLTF